MKREPGMRTRGQPGAHGGLRPPAAGAATHFFPLLLPLLLCLPLAACSSPMAPLDPESVELSTTFHERVPNAWGGAGEIVVEGRLGDNACQGMRGEAFRRGMEIQLRIHATRDACQMAGRVMGPRPSSAPYKATIRDLAPGLYHIRVIHVIEGFVTEMPIERTVEVE